MAGDGPMGPPPGEGGPPPGDMAGNLTKVTRQWDLPDMGGESRQWDLPIWVVTQQWDL